MMYNLHTHTYRCNHASGADRAYVEYAIKAGIKVLGISDHCP
ncbi:MAG: PHP domain-containing protein, partial [Ruminococcus sp.]